MPTPDGDARRHAPATLRNREPILAVLRRTLPPRGTVLEIASGGGEHAAHFAAALPALRWQPSDLDEDALASIAAYAGDAPNLLPPLRLDAASWPWPIARADAIVAVNMVHIAPWDATLGLVRGAAALLPAGGALYLYGPYRRNGRHTADSNRVFDEWLRRQNPAWGVRDVDEVAGAAAGHGFSLAEIVEMPVNNLSLVLRRS